MKKQSDKQFMLIALRPFKARGLNFNIGDE